MKYKINILRKIDPAYPVAILLLKEKDQPLKFPASIKFIFDFREFIVNQVERNNFLFHLPKTGQFVFIQVIETGKEDKKYRISEKVRIAGSKLQKEIKRWAFINVLIACPGHDEFLSIYAEGFILSDYQFLKYKSVKKISLIEEIILAGEKLDPFVPVYLGAISEAVFIARDLINEPASFLTAVQLGREINTLGKKYGFFTEVLNKQKIDSLKMGGLIAVNRGSQDPPTFSILEWKPVHPVNKNPVVLVGKGIVFDSGGLSLKPTLDSMDRMKSDMAGAAVVTGIFCAFAKLKIPVHLIGLIPATDNRPGEKAYLPGDVITMYDGTKVEVLNTDAEGRLILADALSYAKKYKPDLVIDIATLTGSAAMATGRFGIVAFEKAGKNKLKVLKKSGKDTYERIVKFPLWDEYEEMIESAVADIKNTGGKDAGAITAAKFLEKFTTYPWIHLDIAGVSFNKSNYNYITAGGSGTGVRLLVDFLKKIYQK